MGTTLQQEELLAVGVVIAFSILGWAGLVGVKIDYGRLLNSVTKINLPPKLAWFVFELPNLIWVVYFLLAKQSSFSLGYFLFMCHYINRTIIYPLTMSTHTKVPLEIVLSAVVFTTANGYLQGIANISTDTTGLPLKLLGTGLFILGMSINIRSDRILQNAKQRLQKDQAEEQAASSKKYAVIDEWLFRYIGSPNYLGEIVEWVGYSIVSGHVYALLFVVSTINVLTPAAIMRNCWNKKNIVGYPQHRKALLPGIL